MSKDKQEILNNLAKAVVEMDEERAVELAARALKVGVTAYEALTEGLVRGMETMGDNFEKGTIFVPELLLSSDALYAGLRILTPHLSAARKRAPHKAVIGVVEGDTHDIGKNIVKIMLEAGGLEVIDLGRDVELSQFVEVAQKEKADLIGLSSLMTTTMGGMKIVIDLLKEQNLRDRFKVLVGGAPVSAGFAKQVGADAYAANAAAAVRVAKNLLASNARI